MTATVMDASIRLLHIIIMTSISESSEPQCALFGVTSLDCAGELFWNLLGENRARVMACTWYECTSAWMTTRSSDERGQAWFRRQYSLHDGKKRQTERR